MAALSAVVFALSWWLGLYLLARDPRKPVLVLAAIGLTSFASVVALDAVRVESAASISDILSSVEVYLARSRSWPPSRRSLSSARRWRATSTARCGWATG
jgi:hypothetical protein